ncbi:MAG: hypothetical protein IH600_07405 [Bacteroidetes bacterium]|nr:hypothetical protein [Bacteroidota bacterium]
MSRRDRSDRFSFRAIPGELLSSHPFRLPAFVVVLALFVVMALPVTSFAQQEIFVPERPGQTWSTEVASPGYVHFEAGVLMQRAGFTPEATDGSLSGGEVYRSTSWQLPAMMLRVGVTEHVEVRLATKYMRMSWRYDPNYFDGGSGQPIEEDRNSGVDVLSVGLKTTLTKENGWIPQSAFIGSLALPSTASSIYDISQPAPDLALSFSHSLAKDLYLGYCVGLSWDGWTPNPLGYGSVMLAFDLDDKMDLFMEYGFEAHRHSPVLHSADAGLVFTVNDDFKIDAWTGFGLGNPDASSASPRLTSIYRPDVFFGAGAAYRLKL